MGGGGGWCCFWNSEGKRTLTAPRRAKLLSMKSLCEWDGRAASKQTNLLTFRASKEAAKTLCLISP